MSRRNRGDRFRSLQRCYETKQADSQLAWLKLIRDRRWSMRQKHSLLDVLTDPTDIYTTSTDELRAIVTDRWQSLDPKIDPQWLESDLSWLDAPDQHLLPTGNQHFPQLLNQVVDPPIALFSKGSPELLKSPVIAIVGSRKPTPAGKRIAEQIAADLSILGIIVVSGLALGIDAAAHSGALQAGEPTIAVMGCGLDTIYPARHRRLFGEVCESGCAISEYPLGVPVSRFTFPQRNRLVSGLSMGVIIIEAAERSGTLITARLATEQNRSVMVVPGSPLSRQYAGSHRLLQDGAALVTSAQDVVAELQIPLQNAVGNIAPDNHGVPSREPHHRLLDYIFSESTRVDDIISSSGLTAAEVSSMLLMLEVEKAIVQADDGGYVKLVK